MDIKEFVRDTLVQISSGVKEAQEIVREDGGFVNPASRTGAKDTADSHLATIHDGQGVFLVDFDVAVRVTEENKANGEAKLKVASVLSLGGGAEDTKENTSTSRISFQVPLAFPVDEVSKNKMLSDEANERAKTDAAMQRATRNNGW